MIAIQKIIELTDGAAPYTYTWSTDDDCITFSKATDTTTGTVNTTVYATSEACITGSTVTLSVVDAAGCPASQTITIANKCDNLTVSPITKTFTNTFSISASSTDCSTVSIEWVYDTGIYELVSESPTTSSSTLILEYKDVNNLPSQTPIKAKVTDCNGCIEYVTYNNQICIPDPYQLTVYMHYDEDQDNFTSGLVTFPLPTNCAAYTYTNNPFATVSVQPGFSFSATTYADNGLAQFVFKGNSSFEGQVIEGSYTLTADNGIVSNSAELTFVFGSKANPRTIYVPDRTWNIDCGDIAGDTVTLNISDEITTTTGTTIDWSTWQVVKSPSNTADPTLSTDSDGDHIISFVLPTPLVNDSFSWVVCDIDGNCSTTTTYTVAECNTPPVATADAVSTECGLTEEIDVLSNDTASDGVIDINSIEIVTAPTSGTAVVSGGKVNYTTNCNTTGSDSFTYRFKDSNGTYSNTATVTLTISCAGVASNVTLCN